jgi:16S rRNA processing protein RimM
VEHLVALGRVVRPHGIRGEVKVAPYNPDSETLPDLTEGYLLVSGKAPREIRILSVRAQNRLFLMKFEGAETRDDAEALVGAELAVPRDRLPAPGEGEVYLVDLLGLPVVDENGEDLGVLVDLMETGANGVLVVKKAGRAEDLLLPDLPDVVLSADPAEGRILVRVPLGLLDD